MQNLCLLDRIAVHQVMEMCKMLGYLCYLKMSIFKVRLEKFLLDNDIEVWLMDDAWRPRADALLAQWESERDVEGYAGVLRMSGR